MHQHDTTSQFDVDELMRRVDEGYIPSDEELAVLARLGRCPACGRRSQATALFEECGNFHLPGDEGEDTSPHETEDSPPSAQSKNDEDDKPEESEDPQDPLQAIPHELRQRRQFVLYRLEERGDKRTKVPYSPSGVRASATDALTWSDYQIVRTTPGYDGIGFVFSSGDPYTGIDLDHCFAAAATLRPWAAEIVAQLKGKAYIERSQSGSGLHLIVRARALASLKQPIPGTTDHEGVEVYSQDRFFVMTGNVYPGSVATIQEAQAEVNTITREYGKKDQHTRGNDGAQGNDGAHWSTGLSDAEAINEALKRYGDKLARLYYQGDLSDYAGDQSSADMGLVGMLAYACGPNPEQIDRTFRVSRLFRDKWDSPRKGTTYGADTIAKVLASRDPRSYYKASRHRRNAIEILGPAALKALPQPEWLIKDVLVAGTLSVLYGAPGTYKSFVALDIAFSIALDRHWQGHLVKQGNVLYIAAESVHAQADRLAALETVHKQEVTAGLDHVPRAVNLSSPQEVAALGEVIREQGKRYRLIVVDTLAQSTVGADENSSRDMGMVADVLQDLCAELDTAILVIHHTTKANGTFRGASPVRGAAVTEIKAEAAHGLVELSCLKLRHAPAFAPITLRATPVPIPNGLTPTSLVFVATSERMPRQGSAHASGPQTPSELQLLTILKTLNGGKRVQRAAWWKVCAGQGVAETTFERARKQLLADHHITREGEGRAAYYSVRTTGFEDMMGDAEREDTP